MQVYCIRFPATPLIFNGGITSVFPSMMEWGKCDEFAAGSPQDQNKQEPLTNPSRQAKKVVKK